jgi:putative transposase
MPHRVSPTERIRGHIDELFAQDKQLPEILEDVARLGAACEDVRPGSRNGYREVTVKTTAGPVQRARPKLRGTSESFASRLFGAARHQDERAGVAGDRLVRAGPIGSRRRG